MLPANRWKLFVNRAVQGQALRHAAWCWFIYHAITWHCTFAFWYRFQFAIGPDASVAAGGLSPYWQFTCTHLPMLCCALLAVPFIAWDVLLQTQRYLGPAFRFQDCLKRLSRGERVSALKIRRGDALIDLEQAFNEFLSSEFGPRERKTQETERATAKPLPSSAPSPTAKLLDEIYASYAFSPALQTPV